MKCSATPGGGASTTRHRSRTKKSRSSASIASQSSAQTRPSPSRRRFDAIHAATSGVDAAGEQAFDGFGARRDPLRQRARQTEHPPRRAVRLARRGRRVDDPDLRQRRRRTVGEQRERDLAAEGVADDDVGRRRPRVGARDQAADVVGARRHGVRRIEGRRGAVQPQVDERRRPLRPPGDETARDRGPVAAAAVDPVQQDDGPPRGAGLGSDDGAGEQVHGRGAPSLSRTAASHRCIRGCRPLRSPATCAITAARWSSSTHPLSRTARPGPERPPRRRPQ